MTKEDRRIWFKILIALSVLLPGFPLLMIVVGRLLCMIGLRHQVFLAALSMGNLYFSLPALIFGSTHFPKQEFGYMPTTTGKVLAAVLYAIIALGLSLPISWPIRMLKPIKPKDSGEPMPSADGDHSRG